MIAEVGLVYNVEGHHCVVQKESRLPICGMDQQIRRPAIRLPNLLIHCIASVSFCMFFYRPEDVSIYIEKEKHVAYKKKCGHKDFFFFFRAAYTSDCRDMMIRSLLCVGLSIYISVVSG